MGVQLESGSPGRLGPTGPPGPTGVAGVNGLVGPTGGLGTTGPLGETGPLGITGPIGPTGIGRLGPTGIMGSIGPTGPSGGPLGPTGPTSIVLGPTGPTSLTPGPTGPTGPSGQGPVGPTGAGVVGPTGPTGHVEVVQGTAGEALNEFDLVYQDFTDSGIFYKAVNNAIMSTDCIGVVTESGGILQGAIGEITVGRKFITNPGWTFPSGSVIYVSSTPGICTDVKPLSGYIKPVGQLVGSNTILFDAQVGWFSLNSVYASADGDQLNIDWNPNNYSPTVDVIAPSVDHLAAHLKGIDTRLLTAGSSSIVTVTAGENLNRFDVVYSDASNSNVAKKAFCDSAEFKAEVIGIVSQVGGISTGNTGSVSLTGTLINSSGSWNWVPFQWVYLSEVPGGLTQTPPNSNGQYVVPVGLATSTNEVSISPMLGWEVSNSIPIQGFKFVEFDETDTVIGLVTPSPNAVITQIVIKVDNPATAGNPTIIVGVGTDTDRDVNSTYADLKTVGIYIYEPFSICGVTPETIIATIDADGQTFSGSISISYMVSNVANSKGSLVAYDFDEDTTSPYTLLDPPDNAILMKVACLVDTPGTGSPTLSIGIAGNTERDFATSDNDLTIAGTYVHEPYTVCGISGNAIILTMANHSGTGIIGRLYVCYNVNS
jgi:hypothetical protein